MTEKEFDQLIKEAGIIAIEHMTKKDVLLLSKDAENKAQNKNLAIP